MNIYVRTTSLALSLATGFATAAFAQAPKSGTSYTGDLGLVSATGNTHLSTLDIGDKIVRTDGLWKFTQLGAYVYGTTNAVQSANQLNLALRTDYTWSPDFGAFVGASYSRNTFAGYRRRTDEILGVAWRAVAAPTDSLGIEVGGDLTQQGNVDSTTMNYPAARLGMNYKHVFSKAAYFQEAADYVPDLQSAGGYRVNSGTSIVAPISAHLGIKMDYAIHYNSKPPAKFGTTDCVLTMGAQVTW